MSIFTGSRMDRMPDVAFRGMSLLFWIRDRFVAVSRLLEEFDLQPGQTVIDYGCGPGSYIAGASRLVGPAGRVWAVDIHELAVQAVERRIIREKLNNVSACLAPDGACPLPADTADRVYALDMFHMVRDPGAFLREINRLTKPSGFLYIDNGHQSRREARRKIMESSAWEIVEESPRFMRCRPVK